jgi:hypothetical protein
VCPPSLTKWWLTTGRNLPKNSLSVLVPSSSAHCISQTVLSAKSPASAAPTADEAISASAKKARAAELAAAEAEEVEQANSLYFGWYYNPVRVCERCHKVYTELDRQRKLRFKHLMRKQREQADKVDDEQQRWREVEQRIFKQRQFVSRLAKMETASTAHHKAQRAQQPGGLLGSHSLAFDSVAGDADPLSGGVAFGRAFRNPVPFNGQQESNALGKSHCSVPFLPFLLLMSDVSVPRISNRRSSCAQQSPAPQALGLERGGQGRRLRTGQHQHPDQAHSAESPGGGAHWSVSAREPRAGRRVL